LVKNAVGTAHITITASDAITNASQSFNLEVQAPEPPELGAITAQTTKANNPVTVSLNVTSPSTPISSLTFTATSSNAGLVSGVTFANDGVKVAATVNLVKDQIGQADITIFANDGFTLVSNSFHLTVTAPVAPTLGNITAQTTSAGSALAIPLVVTSPDTAITNLTFHGSSTNSALVSGVSFAYNGTTEVATVNLVPNKSGDDVVTISVHDNFGQTNSVSFALHVTSATAPKLGVSIQSGQLHITLTGSPNASYGLETTSDFKTWTDTGLTITADASGNASQTIPLPASPYLFARAVVK